MFDDRSSESALERARWVGFGASGGDGVARKTSPMVARSLRAVSRRPRASTVRRTARTSGAVNSAIGRAPIAGRARLNSHSTLAIVCSAFPSRRFLSNSSAVMASKVLAKFATLATLASCLARVRLLTIGQEPLGVFPRLARFLKANRRIDANGQRFLHIIEPIGLPPSFRAIGRNPQLQPSAVRKLEDFSARLSGADLGV